MKSSKFAAFLAIVALAAFVGATSAPAEDINPGCGGATKATEDCAKTCIQAIGTGCGGTADKTAEKTTEKAAPKACAKTCAKACAKACAQAVHACAGHKDGKGCTMSFACAGKDSDRGYLGIRMQEVEGGLAEALDVEENSGVLINDVVDDSPADEAGLEAGDIVVAVADEDVKTPSDLQSAVRANKPGDEIEIRFLRDGESRTIKAKLAEAPVAREHFFEQVRELPCKLGGKLEKLHLVGEHGFLGVLTQSLNGDLGEYFGVEEGEGALVTEVVEDSPAAELGLQAGDVIIEVAGDEVEDPGDLREIVSGFEEETEVEVVWIRDRKKRDGKTTLEIREGALDRTFNISLWDDDEDFDDDHHFRISPRQMRRHHLPEDVIIEKRVIREEMDETIEDLREELETLREELDEIRKDLSSD